MEKVYNAYIKQIGNRPFYFVKEYWTFPELQEVNPYLKGYGMHTDFNRACDIAQIDDPAIREKLWLETGGSLQVHNISQPEYSEQAISWKNIKPLHTAYLLKWKRQFRLGF